MDFDKKDISSSMSRYTEHAKWTIKRTPSGSEPVETSQKNQVHYVALLSVSISKK